VKYPDIVHDDDGQGSFTQGKSLLWKLVHFERLESPIDCMHNGGTETTAWPALDISVTAQYELVHKGYARILAKNDVSFQSRGSCTRGGAEDAVVLWYTSSTLYHILAVIRLSETTSLLNKTRD
jgi:hypothetical protein